MRVSETREKQIRVNQRLGVLGLSTNYRVQDEIDGIHLLNKKNPLSSFFQLKSFKKVTRNLPLFLYLWPR